MYPYDTNTENLYTLSYTTLFRSRPKSVMNFFAQASSAMPTQGASMVILAARVAAVASAAPSRESASVDDTTWERSEEHKSELQSHVNLVCRLLLEKKKRSWTNRS